MFFVGILCLGGFATLSSPQQGHQLTMGLYLPGTAHAMLGGLQRAQRLRRPKTGFGLGL